MGVLYYRVPYFRQPPHPQNPEIPSPPLRLGRALAEAVVEEGQDADAPHHLLWVQASSKQV